MIDDKLAKLEARLSDLEHWNKCLQYENESIKAELRRLAEQTEDLSKDHDLLCKDHALLSDDFLEIWEKHCDRLSSLSVLAGNMANKVFPNLADAYEEIDRALGIDDKKRD